MRLDEFLTNLREQQLAQRQEMERIKVIQSKCRHEDIDEMSVRFDGPMPENPDLRSFYECKSCHAYWNMKELKKMAMKLEM
jgi:hypothetical protein